MRNILYALISFGLFIGCTNRCDDCSENIPTQPVPGGKGGPHAIAIFPKKNNTPVTSRVYLKYAAVAAPSDTGLYDEAMNTMVEPGFGAHVHFNQLQKGFYYIFAKSTVGTALHGDTILHINDSSAISFDFNLSMHP